MLVDAKRAEDAQCGAFRVRCIHDFSVLPRELFITEGDEFRWICHASRRSGKSSNGRPQGRNANRGPFGPRNRQVSISLFHGTVRGRMNPARWRNPATKSLMNRAQVTG